MVQAAAEGAIDYALADPLDNRFWLKNAWICGELLRKRKLEYSHAILSQKQAYLSNARLNGAAVGSLQDDAAQRLDEIYDGLFPWQQVQAGTTLGEKEINELEALYIQEFGSFDPNGPEVQELVAAINKRDEIEEEPAF